MPTAPPRSLRALLADLVDYAGLFPPAALPFDEAFATYERHGREPERWMLARFVCPADRLDGLDAHAPSASDAPLRLSVLGSKTAADPVADFAQTVAATRRCLERHDGRVTVDAFEVKAPAAEPAGATAALATLRDEAAALRLGPDALTLFLEVPPADRAAFGAFVDTMADAGYRSGGVAFGLKLRCGGPTATDVPAPADLAAAVVGCARAGVPFKATAGLHHPLRRYDEALGTHTHGFLNLFGAAALAAAHDLDAESVEAILLDEDPGSLSFTDDAMRWGDASASTESIRQARRSLARSFGSCSFAEPRDDLRALGLLPRT